MTLPRSKHRPALRIAAILAQIACGSSAVLSGEASAQQSTMPAIADSPTAQTLFDDLRMQAPENPAAAAKLARRLLDEYGGRVIRTGAESDELFISVASETERFLTAHPEVLARFRDLESRAADRMLREEGARAAASRRRLTPAGLRASIQLAEDALRSDRATESLSELARLAGHPDLSGPDALAAGVIEASALRRLGRDEAARAVCERFAAIEGVAPALVDAARAAVERTTKGPAPIVGRSPLAPGRDSGEPNDAWREVWSLELDQSVFRRTLGNAIGVRRQQDVERARNDATLMVAVPTVLDDRIFISEGHRVRAIDLDSRDEVWSRDIGSVGVERESGSIGDLSAIAADRDAVVLFEGHALLNMRSAASRVWCLDPATGATRWATDIDGCNGREDLEGLFPVGAPLIRSDTIVVAARKPTQRLEQVDWLLGLDRRDGRLKWANSIAGSSGSRLSLGRRHAGVSSDGPSVVVATPLGVVASVQAADGVVSWLRRFPVPLRESRSIAEPWEAFAPALAADRVIALTPDELEVVALDRATGRTLEARPVGPDTAWRTPSYILAAPQDDGRAIVLGVGSDIVAFDSADLSKRLWSLSEAAIALEPPRAGADNRAGIRGRVSVAGDWVVVPGVEDILLLDVRTGRLGGRIPMARPSNPLLLADRIVAAGDDTLQVIMPPEQAESMLRKRLASMPDDPAAAIALMELAAATGRPSVALDAARMAERAIVKSGASEATRSELLDKLDAFVATHPELGGTVFEIAGSVANAPSLRVRVELARGEHLRSNGRPREAVECWRSVATDPLLGGQLAGAGLVRRQVRMEALSRIARLAARDREVSASLEAAASVAREKLPASPTARELAALATAHPRSLALAEALATSSHLPDSEWRPLAAVVLSDALLPPARTDAVDMVLAEESRRSGQGLVPGAANAFAVRVAQLAQASGVDRGQTLRSVSTLPRVGAAPTAGIDLRPRLPEETGAARMHRDHSLVLGLADGSLVRLSGPQLGVAWRLRLDDRDPQVHWANGRIVLWQRPQKGDSSALIVDAADGTLVYSTPRSGELWPVNGLDVPALGAGERQPRIPTLPTAVVPLCDADDLVLVRRNGDIARVAFMDPKPQAVTRRGVIEQVSAESLSEDTVAIAGRRSSSDGSRPVVMLLDARTLATRLEFEPIGGSDPKWVVVTALGEVFLGTRTTIERWAPTAMGAFAPTMVCLTPESADSTTPRLLGAHLLTLDPEGRPSVTPVFEGDQRALTLGRPEDPQIVRGIEPLPEGLLIQSEDRLHLFSQAAERIGADSCLRDAQIALPVPVQGGVLKVYSVQSVPDGGRVRADLSCVVERLSPASGLRNLGGSFEVPGGETSVSRALAVDGWLLLSHSQGTIAVSMPLGPAGEEEAKSGLPKP